MKIKDMLDRGKLFFSFFLFCIINQSCEFINTRKDIDNSIVFKKNISGNAYNKIYDSACDSIKNWSLNKLDNFSFNGKGKNFILDSLLCFNNDTNRFISALLNINKSNSSSDGIDYFYGEKINNNWFFFRGAYIVVPREMVSNHPINQPLSYQQLHQIALKEVYGGYLKKNGEINEAWFTSYFEGPDWGDFNDQKSSEKFLNLNGKRFDNKREFFEAIHLQSIKNNWYGINRDSIKQLPTKTNLP